MLANVLMEDRSFGLLETYTRFLGGLTMTAKPLWSTSITHLFDSGSLLRFQYV